MKQFDFEQVGKRMPYSVPDGFFDKLEENVMEGLSPNPRPTPLSRWRGTGMRLLLAIAAAIALFFVVQPMFTKSSTGDFESVELAFNNLSTEDQDFLLQVYEEDDLFFNP